MKKTQNRKLDGRGRIQLIAVKGFGRHLEKPDASGFSYAIIPYFQSTSPNMSRALSRDKFGQTPCFSGPGLIIWPASLPRWTCLDRRASSQSNIRGFAGRAAASDRRGSPPRALYVAGVASQFVATAGGVTFGLKSLPAGVPREQRPRE